MDLSVGRTEEAARMDDPVSRGSRGCAVSTSALAVSRGSRAGLVDAGGRFMAGEEMAAAAKPLGMRAGGLYFRGRAGALGEVSSQVATAVIGIFPSWVVDLTWRESAALPAEVAVDVYSAACTHWGQRYLSTIAGMDRMAALAERVIDAAEASALPLFAAWRARSRPESIGGRGAKALAVLRELCGGLHFSALRSHGLDIPVAVLADPNGGVARLRRTAWRQEEIELLQQRAAAIPDLAGRWAAAEQDTDCAFAGQLAVLDDAEQAELAALIDQAEAASRPPVDDATASRSEQPQDP
jgi:Helix-turn-helix family